MSEQEKSKENLSINQGDRIKQGQGTFWDYLGHMIYDNIELVKLFFCFLFAAVLVSIMPFLLNIASGKQEPQHKVKDSISNCQIEYFKITIDNEQGTIKYE